MSITVETAPDYGTFLLNDGNERIVEGNAKELPFPLEIIMTKMYEKCMACRMWWNMEEAN